MPKGFPIIIQAMVTIKLPTKATNPPFFEDIKGAKIMNSNKTVIEDRKALAKKKVLIIPGTPSANGTGIRPMRTDTILVIQILFFSLGFIIGIKKSFTINAVAPN